MLSRFKLSTRSLAKSRSTDAFFHQATQRSTQYHSSRIPCLACAHQQSNTLRHDHHSTMRTERGDKIVPPSPVASEDYYSLSKQMVRQDAVQLKRSKRFIEEMFDNGKQEWTKKQRAFQARVQKLNQQLATKDRAIQDLQIKNGLYSKYNNAASRSVVRPYSQIQDQAEAKLKQMAGLLNEMQQQNTLLEQQLQLKQKKIKQLQKLQQKVKEGEIYAQEYQNAREAADRISFQMQQAQRKYGKDIQLINKRHQEEINAHREAIQQYKRVLVQHKNIINTREDEIRTLKQQRQRNNEAQYQRLYDLVQTKNAQIQKLQSKITCIQAQLKFIKSRFGYLLRNTPVQATTRVQLQPVGEAQQFVIERVGRYDPSTGRESLIGMNLSPIRNKR